MSDANIAPRDPNHVPSMLFVGSDGLTYPCEGDESTGRLLVDSASGSGTVTTVSVASANGFAGTVATATTTPAITISTTVTGMLYGNGTAISAATISTGLTLTTSTLTNNLSTGVSGGQTAIGGTASGNSLTLSSTSHGTKGKILFGTSGYDEVNNRLGIGTASPSYGLHVVGTAYISSFTGIGAVPSGSYNFEVTGSSNFSSTTYFRGITYHFNGTNNYFGMQAVGTVNKIFTTAGSTNKDIVINPSDTTSATFAADGTIGFGSATTPSAQVHIIKTTEQLRVGYDISNYWNATTSSAGITTFNAVGASSSFVFSDKTTFSNEVVYTNNAITASGNAATIPVTARLHTVTNNSAATLTITFTTTGATDGQLQMVRIYDFSGVAQTLTLVNTENSTVTPPTTTNGSTTLPLTLGLQFNSATTKWRILASA